MGAVRNAVAYLAEILNLLQFLQGLSDREFLTDAPSAGARVFRLLIGRFGGWGGR